MAPTEDAARFGFGANWLQFIESLSEAQIREAERSLQDMLGTTSIRGKQFLDVGSGSGLFSLAAARLGASRVHSFDYDEQSVACTRAIKARYAPDLPNWTIEQGDILDQGYVEQLGSWDIVYSWGVLHHTGNMWQAMEHVADLTAKSGTAYIAIYNDQGLLSRGWLRIKQLYNSGVWGRRLVTYLFVPYFVGRNFVGDLVRGQNPITGYTAYNRSRGMSRVRDWHDWLGGYPFEVANPGDVTEHFRRHGFLLERISTVGGRLGCNEFVLIRSFKNDHKVTQSGP